ncbi:MAG: Omp28-related outer membrane protein, partial [Chlamydiia bacterium]|nr:Omp28-related outer membrane protein [Chlamydiia bacterium]
PENKNVVLEEYTGIHCGYCPQGHAIAQAIYDANPDDVVLINIHTGGYAVPSGSEPDFRTEEGNAIAGQSGVTGYPMGSVNRHVFSGSTTAMSRGAWTAAANQIMGEASYLNVGVEATIITSTRQLVVEVEVYYTADSPLSTNLMSVALLQSNIIANQSGGSSNYNHKHALRDMLTGTWGYEITETTEGSLYATTIVFEIPDAYANVDVILEDIDIVAFVSETHQEIISGSMAEISFIESLETDAAIASIVTPQTTCGDEYNAEVSLKNYGTNSLTAIDFEYYVNEEEVQTYTWTGNLAQNETEIVELPSFAIMANQSNVFHVDAKNPNGNDDQLEGNNSASSNFEKTAYLPQNCKLAILTDDKPEETTWDIKDSEGTIIASGGPYASSGIKLEEFTWPTNGCYTLTMHDAGGDGMENGFYKITNASTQIIWVGDNEFGYKATAQFSYDELMGVSQTTLDNDVTIYPNPITSNAQIEFNLIEQSEVTIDIYNILGKKIQQLQDGTMASGLQKVQINTDNLDGGIYFVNITINNNTISKKVNIIK